MIREMLVHVPSQSAVSEVDHLQKEKKCFRAHRAKLWSLSDTPAECAFKNWDVLSPRMEHHHHREVLAADVWRISSK